MTTIEPLYRGFREVNDHEGETWFFWIPVPGNEEAINRLDKYLADWIEKEGDKSFTLRNSGTEALVDSMIEREDEGDEGYYPRHTKLVGKLTLPPDLDKEWRDPYNALYKGGILDFMEERE